MVACTGMKKIENIWKMGYCDFLYIFCVNMQKWFWFQFRYSKYKEVKKNVTPHDHSRTAMLIIFLNGLKLYQLKKTEYDIKKLQNVRNVVVLIPNDLFRQNWIADLYTFCKDILPSLFYQFYILTVKKKIILLLKLTLLHC